MKWTDEQIQARYAQVDLDEKNILEQKMYGQICARNNSFKRKTVWGLCAAGAAAAVLMAVLQFLPQHEPTYRPDPGAFDRMQFAFYRELALPGQDLGISYDDFAPSAPETRS